MASYARFNNLEEQYTVPTWVDEGKANLLPSRANLVMKQLSADGKVITPYQSLMSKYYETFTRFIRERTLTTEEYNLYRFSPKKLSMDLYGTPELWFALLYINGMASMMEFNKKTIKIFDASILDAIDELCSILDEDIETNKTEVYKK